MTVAKKKSVITVRNEHIIAAILASTREMLEEHIAEAMELVDQSETSAVVINLPSKIDCSESQPSVTTTLRFTKSFTDKRSKQLEDPSQGSLPFRDTTNDEPELPSTNGEAQEEGEAKEKSETKERSITRTIPTDGEPEKKRGRGRPKKNA
jgi:hypothetical protein